MSAPPSRLERVAAWLKGSGSEPFLFGGLLLAHVAFIWAFPVFVTQDGPSHLDNAHILLKYFGPDGAILREYYLLNTGILTNWLGELILAGLSWLFPPFVAEKLMFSGYAVLLPLAIRYAIGRTGSGSRFVSLFSFPLTFSWFLFMGFQNFSYSLSFFFFYVGYLMHCRGRYGLRQGSILIGLGYLLALWHIFSLMMAIWAAGFWSVWMVLFEMRRRRRDETAGVRRLWRLFVSTVLPPLAFFIPALLLVATFFSTHGGSKTLIWNRTNELFYLLATGNVLVAFRGWERLPAVLFVAILVSTAVGLLYWKLMRHDLRLEDAWLVLAVWSFFLYLALPSYAMDAGSITPRAGLYVYLTLLLWLGAQTYHRLTAGWLKGAAVVLAAGFLLLRVGPMSTANRYLALYLSATEHVRPGATLLPLFATDLDFERQAMVVKRVRFLLHASGYITAAKNGVNLNNYEARQGYFPVNYRPKLNPSLLLPTGRNGHLESENPDVDILSYPARSGGQIDYVLMWGYLPERVNDEASRSLMRQLEQGYVFVAASSGKGLMKLYRRKDLKAP